MDAAAGSCHQPLTRYAGRLYERGVPMPEPAKLLTQDRAMRDGFTLHPKDEEFLRAIKVVIEEPLPEHLTAVMKVGGFIPPAFT